MHKGFFATAAFLGAATVALGAFGAHTLKTLISESSLSVYETAVRYQFYHVFAIALAAIAFKTYPNKLIKAAAQLFIIGIIFFSGSLYLLTYGAVSGKSFTWAGPVTPLGGLLLIAGWICLGLGVRSGK